MSTMRFQSSILLLALLLVGCSSQVDEQLKYLQQTPPSLSPEVFAPDIISTAEEYEFGSVFNPDGTVFYYGVDVDGKAEIRYSELIGDTWSAPDTVLVHEEYGYNDPFLSPDGKQLYFISNQPMNGEGPPKDYDIWYIEKEDNGWSKPINAGPNINAESEEYYISFTSEGTMYFSSNVREVDFDIYAAPFVDGEFQEAVSLGDSINTTNYEADVFVAPDESYVIFCANRPEGLGRGDLYISFKNEDGSWSKSKNMGAPINSEYHELCPFVSQDGKYFFYTSNQDIYWVSAEVIERYRE